MYNNRRNNNYRRPDNRQDGATRGERQDGYRNYPAKKYSKTMILLKSGVFIMFLILIASVVAYAIVKSKKTSSHASDSYQIDGCKKQEVIKIKENIDEIASDKKSVLILTKADKNGKQELIKIDSHCGNETSRIILQKINN